MRSMSNNRSSLASFRALAMRYSVLIIFLIFNNIFFSSLNAKTIKNTAEILIFSAVFLIAYYRFVCLILLLGGSLSWITRFVTQFFL